MNTITSIAECVTLATQLKRDWFPHEPTWGPWFRGHSDTAWKPTPKLYRVKSPKRGIRIIEDEIRQEFIMRASWDHLWLPSLLLSCGMTRICIAQSCHHQRPNVLIGHLGVVAYELQHNSDHLSVFDTCWYAEWSRRILLCLRIHE